MTTSSDPPVGRTDAHASDAAELLEQYHRVAPESVEAYLESLQVVLAGNALAVHDIEYALSGTSLGIDLAAGAPVEQGHRNHMAAINTVNRAGGIRQAVESGVVKSGVMANLVCAPP